MANTYYGKSLEKLKELNAEGNLTKEKWDLYAKLHGFYSAESLMFIHSNTENWELFLENLKKRKL